MAHPQAFRGVPATRAVKQEKPAFPVRQIPAVQRLNPRFGPLNQRRIPGQDLLRRIPEIRQQGEVKVLIPVREVVNLQGLDQAVDVVQAREHRGDDHHGAALRSDAL